MLDTFKTKGLRKQLTDVLREKGIDNEQVLSAIGEVPRHLFIDSSFLAFAYEDKPFPIGEGQTISQPYTVAIQTMLLQVKQGEKVLEVGTGSGYQAAILETLGAKVYSIERQKQLYLKTKKFLKEMHYKINVYFGDGYAGLPDFSPFDKIIVTCGAPYIPEALVSQLKVGGTMIIPLGVDAQEMLEIRKVNEQKCEEIKHGTFRFVPMLENKQG